MSNNNNLPSIKAKITWINDDPAQSKKAAASITIANAFQVHGLSIVEGPKGLFLSMPQRQTTDKKFVEIAHPISAEMRKAITDAVFDAYSQTMAMSEQYKTEFQKKVGSSETDASQGDATHSELPIEVESAENEAEKGNQVPTMGQIQ